MESSLGALFFSFSGRLNRAGYWTRAFPVLLAGGLIVNAVLAVEVRSMGHQGVVSMVLGLAALWPVLAVLVKRFHDRGRSAWFLLVFLIPIAGPIWLLVEAWFLPGTADANRFGEPPQDRGASRALVISLSAVGVVALVALFGWTFFTSEGPAAVRLAPAVVERAAPAVRFDRAPASVLQSAPTPAYPSAAPARVPAGK